MLNANAHLLDLILIWDNTKGKIKIQGFFFVLSPLAKKKHAGFFYYRRKLKSVFNKLKKKISHVAQTFHEY